MTTHDHAISIAQTNKSSRLLPLVALIAAIAAFVEVTYQLATPGPAGATYNSASDYVREFAFLTYLIATMVAVLAARPVGIIKRVPASLIVVGYGLLTIGVTIGLALRDDPDWFFLLGGPGNLLAAIGFVVWAIQAAHHRVFPWWLALLCGVGGFIAVLGAEVGTTVVIGVFWTALAWRYRSAGRTPTHV
jgi:hypothetical protein